MTYVVIALLFALIIAVPEYRTPRPDSAKPAALSERDPAV